MRPCSPAVLLALLLFVTASVARAQPSACQTELRRVELGAEGASAPELCISPGLSTTMLFDRPLARDAVVLEGHERFRRVDAAGSLLVLVPSEKLKVGERLQLTVRFTGTEAPQSTSFVLVVHRDQAERQVEISRASGASESCQVDLRQKEAELQRCLEQVGRPPPRPEPRASLAELLANNVLNDKSLVLQKLKPRELTQAPGERFGVTGVTLYRSRTRIVVAVDVESLDDTTPWQAVGALFLSAPGESLSPLWVVQPVPLQGGATGKVWVEAELPTEGTRRSYTLQLWDEGKARTLTIPGLRFP